MTTEKRTFIEAITNDVKLAMDEFREEIQLSNDQVDPDGYMELAGKAASRKIALIVWRMVAYGLEDEEIDDILEDTESDWSLSEIKEIVQF